MLRLIATPHCMCKGTLERGTFTTQVKRYILGSKPCNRVFTTIGKKTNHAK